MLFHHEEEGGIDQERGRGDLGKRGRGGGERSVVFELFWACLGLSQDMVRGGERRNDFGP